jgi:hypothetical protein
MVVKLVDRVLQLAIENEAIGDHDDTVEEALILCVMKTGETM